MAKDIWPTRLLSVASLQLDSKNPRLGRETLSRAPRDIIQYLFDHDKAIDVAHSIALRGYFPNEPLLAVKEKDRIVIVEGNRRLAALKALREPGLLEGSISRKVERFSHQITNLQSIARVPVTIAPNRRATDRILAGRHIGTPVLAWQAENRASFILEKLDEGYSNDRLEEELGFTLNDIQKARQTRAIADMARSLELPEEVKVKLDNPRARIFSTINRIFDSSVGRKFFRVERSSDHGLRGKTTKAEFVKGFTKLVTDIALSKEDSRSLNKDTDIEIYFKEKWDAKDKPKQKRGSFVPADVITGKSVASQDDKSKPSEAQYKIKPENKNVLPRNLQVRFGNERLVDIRKELVKLKRGDFPNAGAVLLRVFFELAVVSYLQRSGELPKIIEKLAGKGKLAFGVPTMKQLMPAIIKAAKKNLPTSDAKLVEKAIRYDHAAPFSISDLHSFVHQASDFPTERDIFQFWNRTEPLFRLMLEQEIEEK